MMTTIREFGERNITVSGMYVVVALGPLGWHGGIKNNPYFAGLTRCSGLIASMEAGLSSRSCREREGGT